MNLKSIWKLRHYFAGMFETNVNDMMFPTVILEWKH